MTAEATEGLLHEVVDGVLRITFDREQKKNALDQASQVAFVRLLEDASQDDSLRAIHLTGAGAQFCSGSDWVASNTNDSDVKPRPASILRRTPLQSARIIELLLTIQLPVVATVRGMAAGMGCQLALAADFAVAEEGATFWEPFVHRGFTPDTGSTWLLPRLVGLARARQMLLLGDKITATQAADWGLIHQAVPAADLERVSGELLSRLASGPTVALGITKQQLLRSSESTLARTFYDETFGLELTSRTKDFREGLSAFAQRRDPDFEGR